MSIPFATRVICYCLGKGRLSLRGAKSRPWLEIRRPEDDHAFLRHQARVLRRLYPGELDVRWDRQPGRSFYDTIVLSVQTDRLWPAYDLLYPRDRRAVPIAALEQTGLTGLSALWCDTGIRGPHKAEVSIADCAATRDELEAWGKELGFPPIVIQSHTGRAVLRWHGELARELMSALRPLVHPSRKRSLWPPRETKKALYA